MKTTWPTKKLGEMKKAWLVRWGCHAQNEDECLKRLGIEEKIVDVISIRKDFDKQIVDIAKDGSIISIEILWASNFFSGDARKVIEMAKPVSE